MALLIAPAVWNGFPLLQYDTGGYLAPWYEGKTGDQPLGALRPLAGRRPLVRFLAGADRAIGAHGLGAGADLARARPRQPAALLLGVDRRAVACSPRCPGSPPFCSPTFSPALSVLALYLLLLRDDDAAPRRAHRPDRARRGRRRDPQRARWPCCSRSSLPPLVWLFDRARIALRALAARRARRWLLGALHGVAADWPRRRHARLDAGRHRRCRSAACCRTASSRNISTTIAPTRPCACAPYKDRIAARRRRFLLGRRRVRQARPLRRACDDEMRRIALASIADYPLLQLKSVHRRNRQAIAAGRHRRRRGQLDLEHL